MKSRAWTLVHGGGQWGQSRRLAQCDGNAANGNSVPVIGGAELVHDFERRRWHAVGVDDDRAYIDLQGPLPLAISHEMGVAGRETEQVDLSLIVRLHHERLAEKVIEDGVVHEDDLWDASN